MIARLNQTRAMRPRSAGGSHASHTSRESQSFQGHNPKRVFVGGLPIIFNGDKETQHVISELKRCFSLFGPIDEIFYVKNRNYCFVSMVSETDAFRIIETWGRSGGPSFTDGTGSAVRCSIGRAAPRGPASISSATSVGSNGGGRGGLEGAHKNSGTRLRRESAPAGAATAVAAAAAAYFASTSTPTITTPLVRGPTLPSNKTPLTPLQIGEPSQSTSSDSAREVMRLLGSGGLAALSSPHTTATTSSRITVSAPPTPVASAAWSESGERAARAYYYAVPAAVAIPAPISTPPPVIPLQPPHITTPLTRPAIETPPPPPPPPPTFSASYLAAATAGAPPYPVWNGLQPWFVEGGTLPSFHQHYYPQEKNLNNGISSNGYGSPVPSDSGSSVSSSQSGGSRVFVGKLGSASSVATVRSHFSRFLIEHGHPLGANAIIDVFMPHDENSWRGPGSHRGFAFITLSDQTAVTLLAGSAHVVDGKSVVIDGVAPRVSQAESESHSDG